MGFVVERHLAIQKFVPERFWSIQLVYAAPTQLHQHRVDDADARDNDDEDENGGPLVDRPSVRGRPRFSNGAAGRRETTGTVSFSWTRGRLFDFLSAFVLYEMVVNAGTFNVVAVRPHPANR